MGLLTGKRFLFLSEVFDPAGGGGVKATSQHFRRLHEEGAEVTVITLTPTYEDRDISYPFTIHRILEPVSSIDYSATKLFNLIYSSLGDNTDKIIDKAKDYPQDYFDYICGYVSFGALDVNNVFTILKEYFHSAITHIIQYDPPFHIDSVDHWKNPPKLDCDLQIVCSPVWSDIIGGDSLVVPVIPIINPIDIPESSLIPWEDRKYDFGFINTILHKGFNTVLKLISSMPNHTFVIKVVGGMGTENPIHDKLEKWFPNVTVVRWHKSMCDFYQDCRTILYPSLWEGFGMVPIEAAANGCLVFANQHPIIEDANPDFPVFIDAYTEEVMANWFHYHRDVTANNIDLMYQDVADEWKEVIEDTLRDPELMDKHIALGLNAIDKHKLKDILLWNQYVKTLCKLT